MTTALLLKDANDETLAKLLAEPPKPSGVISVPEAGTIIKAQVADRYLLTVAYPAMKADVGRAKDGFRDFATADAVEKCCWNFMRKGCKLGLWHEKGHEDCGEVVENYVYRGPDWSQPDGQVVKAGDWLVGSILSPYAWEMYEKGLIGGASPQGPCQRELEPSSDLLAGLRS